MAWEARSARAIRTLAALFADASGGGGGNDVRAADIGRVLEWPNLDRVLPAHVPRAIANIILQNIHRVPVVEGRFRLVDAVYRMEDNDYFLEQLVKAQTLKAVEAGDLWGYIGLVTRTQQWVERSSPVIDHVAWAGLRAGAPMSVLLIPRTAMTDTCDDSILSALILDSKDVAVQGMLVLHRLWCPFLPRSRAAFLRTKRYIKWAVRNHFAEGCEGDVADWFSNSASYSHVEDRDPCARLCGHGLHDYVAESGSEGFKARQVLDLLGRGPLEILRGFLEVASEALAGECVGALSRDWCYGDDVALAHLSEALARHRFGEEVMAGALARTVKLRGPQTCAMTELLMMCGANPHLVPGAPASCRVQYDEWSAARRQWILVCVCRGPAGPRCGDPPSPSEKMTTLDPYWGKWRAPFRARFEGIDNTYRGPEYKQSGDDASDASDASDDDLEDYDAAMAREIEKFNTWAEEAPAPLSYEDVVDYLGPDTTQCLADNLFVWIDAVKVEDKLALFDAYANPCGSGGWWWDKHVVRDMYNTLALHADVAGLQYVAGLVTRGVRMADDDIQAISMDPKFAFALHVLVSRHKRLQVAQMPGPWL